MKSISLHFDRAPLLIENLPKSMIQTARGASHLAARIAKPSCLRPSRDTIRSTAFQGIPKYFSTPARKKLSEHTKTAFLRRVPATQTIRYCSHQRNMCRAHEGLASGSLDITKGREVLPTNVKPIHYDLTLEPNFETFTYEGTVVIEYVQSRV